MHEISCVVQFITASGKIICAKTASFVSDAKETILSCIAGVDTKEVVPVAKSDNSKLQNCPFCGSEARVCLGGKPWVVCSGDDCEFCGPYKKTKSEAIQAWNSIKIVSDKPGCLGTPLGHAIYGNDSDDEDDTPTTNQGRDTCFKCGAKTTKVDTGMFTVLDICPKCKI